MSYSAPVADIRFLLDNVVGFSQLTHFPKFEDVTPELVESILTEAGRMSEDVVAPLQRIGDLQPAHLENGAVRMPAGFEDGWQAIAEGGWIGMSADPEHGGLGLPVTLAMAVNELIGSACLALELLPLMSQGQIEALEYHASDVIKAMYLPKLISGEWAGTMNLTEPQAGSDVGALRTKAEPQADGSFTLTGQKIYISGGDHDLTANICHLVLGRLPDAAPGTKGISLFLVPKYLPDADGNPGERNAIRTVSLEHKMGLAGNPTAVLSYEGAKGWLVGEPHKGMAAMFTMMNNARLGVGVQGVSVAEAATQKALAYAQERQQGRTLGDEGTIFGHADVRRMLIEMKAQTVAARAIALECGVAIDMANATHDQSWVDRAAFLTPIAKAFGTDIGIVVANTGIQVHGGMGYIEETGAAQYLRDVRVTAIYEGTNGIQAADLVGRKMLDGGAAAQALITEIVAVDHADLKATAARLAEVTSWVCAADLNDRFAGSVAYLAAFARILGAKHLLKAGQHDARYGRLAAVYVPRALAEAQAELDKVTLGAAPLYNVRAEDLAV